MNRISLWTQEWYCTSKAIAQIMIVFIISIYDEFNTQTWYFIKVAATRLFCTTTCRRAHWTRWSLFAGEVLFESKYPDFNQAAGDSGPQRWFARIWGQPEEPRLLHERDAQLFLISSLMKQVLKSPNKSTMIDDLINNYSQKMRKKSITTLYHGGIQKIMLCRTVTWDDMKF